MLLKFHGSKVPLSSAHPSRLVNRYIFSRVCIACLKYGPLTFSGESATLRASTYSSDYLDQKGTAIYTRRGCRCIEKSLVFCRFKKDGVWPMKVENHRKLSFSNGGALADANDNIIEVAVHWAEWIT